MIAGVYLSGTGNTKHCVEQLVHSLEKDSECISIEDKNAISIIERADMIVFGYPVQFSNAPIMARDFIKKHGQIWNGKKIFCLATMGAFSGDGAGCSARIFKKYGAKIIGGLHLKMPDSICDNRLLKGSDDTNKHIIQAADDKIAHAVHKIKAGKPPKEGLNFFYHMAGLFVQRLWFYGKTTHYTDKLTISDDCIGCGLCQAICPMHNITLKDSKDSHTKKASASNQCTMCYRCANACPQKAITLLGKKVHQQYKSPFIKAQNKSQT